MNIINPKLDFHLIKFPILFPIIYFLILKFFPDYENHLIILTILILAEPHFGATWPFFINKTNYKYISQNKFSLVYSPIFLFLFCIIFYFVAPKIFLLIFFASNIYHVTRQSYGICKLYSSDKNELFLQEIGLYTFNFLFFLIGYLKFYLNISTIFGLNIFLFASLFLFLIYFLVYIFKYSFSENLLTTISGIIIFFPICFVTNPVHAIIMGVTIHYSQYLAFTYKVAEKRETFKAKLKFNYRFITTIAIYSIIMTLLSLTKTFDHKILSSLIIIPISFQMLHFYLDSQLWKFSVEHNRRNVLDHLKSN